MIGMAKLNHYGLGGSFGILWGAYMGLLALTTQAQINRFFFNKANFDMVQSMYASSLYTPTLGGAVVGFILGLACGFICGVIIALLYNAISEKFPRK